MAENKITQELEILLEDAEFISAIEKNSKYFNDVAKRLGSMMSTVSSSITGLQRTITSNLSEISNTTAKTIDTEFTAIQKSVTTTQNVLNRELRKIPKTLKDTFTLDIMPEAGLNSVAERASKAALKTASTIGKIFQTSSSVIENLSQNAIGSLENIGKVSNNVENDIRNIFSENEQIQNAIRDYKLLNNELLKLQKSGREAGQALDISRTSSTTTSQFLKRSLAQKEILESSIAAYGAKEGTVGLTAQETKDYEVAKLKQKVLEQQIETEVKLQAAQEIRYKKTQTAYDKIIKQISIQRTSLEQLSTAIPQAQENLTFKRESSRDTLFTQYNEDLGKTQNIIAQTKEEFNKLFQSMETRGTKATGSDLSQIFTVVRDKINETTQSLNNYTNLMQILANSGDAAAKQMVEGFRQQTVALKEEKKELESVMSLFQKINLSEITSKMQKDLTSITKNVNFAGIIDYRDAVTKLSEYREPNSFKGGNVEVSQAYDKYQEIQNIYKDYSDNINKLQEKIYKYQIQLDKLDVAAARETNENKKAIYIAAYKAIERELAKFKEVESELTSYTNIMDINQYSGSFKAALAQYKNEINTASKEWFKVDTVLEELKQKHAEVALASKNYTNSSRSQVENLRQSFKEQRDEFKQNIKEITEAIKTLKNKAFSETGIDTRSDVAALETLKRKYQENVSEIGLMYRQIAAYDKQQADQINKGYFKRFFEQVRDLRWQIISVIYIARQAYDTFQQYFVETAKSVDTFQRSVLALTGSIGINVFGGLKENYNKVYNYALNLTEKLAAQSAKTYASLEDLQILTKTFAQAGILVRTDKDIKNIGTISSAIKVLTEDMTNAGVQMRQEIYALLQGRARATDTLSMMMKLVFGSQIKENIKLWKEQGTLVENLAKYLEPFEAINEHISELLSNQIKNYEVMMGYIQRTALTDTIKSWAKYIKEFTDSFGSVETGLSERGKNIAIAIRGAFEILGTTLKYVADIITSIIDSLLVVLNLGNSAKLGFNGWQILFVTINGTLMNIANTFDLIEGIILDINNALRDFGDLTNRNQKLTGTLWTHTKDVFSKFASGNFTEAFKSAWNFDPQNELEKTGTKFQSFSSNTEAALKRIEQRGKDFVKTFKELGDTSTFSKKTGQNLPTLQTIGLNDVDFSAIDAIDKKMQSFKTKNMTALEKSKIETEDEASQIQEVMDKLYNALTKLTSNYLASSTHSKTEMEQYSNTARVISEEYNKLSQHKLEVEQSYNRALQAEEQKKYDKFIELQDTYQGKALEGIDKFYEEYQKALDKNNKEFEKEPIYKSLLDQAALDAYQRKFDDYIDGIKKKINDLQNQNKDNKYVELEIKVTNFKENYQKELNQVKQSIQKYTDEIVNQQMLINSSQKGTTEEQKKQLQLLQDELDKRKETLDMMNQHIQAYETMIEKQRQAISNEEKRKTMGVISQARGDVTTQTYKDYEDTAEKIRLLEEDLKKLREAQAPDLEVIALKEKAINELLERQKRNTEQLNIEREKRVADIQAESLPDLAKSKAKYSASNKANLVEIQKELESINALNKAYNDAMANNDESAAKAAKQALEGETATYKSMLDEQLAAKDAQARKELEIGVNQDKEFKSLLRNIKSYAASENPVETLNEYLEDTMDKIQNIAKINEAVSADISSTNSQLLAELEKAGERGSQKLSREYEGKFKDLKRKVFGVEASDFDKVSEEYANYGRDIDELIQKYPKWNANAVELKQSLDVQKEISLNRVAKEHDLKVQQKYSDLLAIQSELLDRSIIPMDKQASSLIKVTSEYQAQIAAIDAWTEEYKKSMSGEEDKTRLTQIMSIAEQMKALRKQIAQEEIKDIYEPFWAEMKKLSESWADDLSSTLADILEDFSSWKDSIDSLMKSIFKQGMTSVIKNYLINPLQNSLTTEGRKTTNSGLGVNLNPASMLSSLTGGAFGGVSTQGSGAQGILGNISLANPMPVTIVSGNAIDTTNNLLTQSNSNSLSMTDKIGNAFTNLESSLSGVFQSLGSVFTSGGSTISSWGSSIMSLFSSSKSVAYASGGEISEPIIGKGLKSGYTYTLGENENEMVTPKSKLKSVGVNSGDTNHYSINIQAIDTQSGAQFLANNSDLLQNLMSKSMKSNKGIRRTIKNAY